MALQLELAEQIVWGQQVLGRTSWGRASWDRALGHLAHETVEPGSGAPPGKHGECHSAFAITPVIDAALRCAQPQLGEAIILRRIKPLIAIGAASAVRGMLTGLLVNAAMMTRGQRRPGVIYIDTDAAGARVRIRISDNGPGVGPGVLACLADLRAATTESGCAHAYDELQACHATVRAHGGALTCTRRVPHGSRFALDLPAAGRRSA